VLIFDSGIGGLGVVRALRKLAPDLALDYLADNGFFPYGDKPDAVLVAHLVALIGRAIERLAPSAIVIACNTASTLALTVLRERYRLPIIGCVPPIKPAAAASLTRHIGVLATAATVRRPYLNSLIHDFASDCMIHTLGAPTLATLAEQKFRGETVDIAAVVAPLFAPLGAGLIDAVALGCTHYTFLLPELTALYPHVAWFDPAAPVARHTLNVTQYINAITPARPPTLYVTAPVADEPDFARRVDHFGFQRVDEFVSLESSRF
jgi:glutamate racemase